MTADDRSSPWGHSRAAHRVHDICSHCWGYSVEEEVIAWRTRENRLHDAATAAPAGNATSTELRRTSEQPCPDCGRETLTVIAVYMRFTTGPRAGDALRLIGGWAHCVTCDATPHPTMEAARG
ncbi:hypothetical protein [Streptomyces sp. BSE6.1]|uniref:hypothetical protein n=1 Tax=Streptomyces sp. BSE6.1 TaxID=2605730 RepID=UPI001F3C3189|nr:hypothetical protein [Streptomyces sp. BSE6.1]